MEIYNHTDCNCVLDAPSDMPEPHCSALPAIETSDEWGKWYVSFWKPNAEEVVRLLEGGYIALHVRAINEDAHPVVGITTQLPDTEAKIQKLLDEEARLSNAGLSDKPEMQKILEEIRLLRGPAPRCLGEDDCSSMCLSTCTWRMDC